MVDEEPSRALWLLHLQRVMDLSEANEGRLSAEDRRAIALELGLDEADLEAARLTAEDHFVRGQGYFERKMWADAITELEEAMALDPERVEIVTTLASAHLRCMMSEDADDHAVPAERFARFALQQDPDDPEAFAVLERLDTHRKEQARLRRKRVITVATGLAALAVFVLLLTYEHLEAPSSDEDGQDGAASSVESGSFLGSSQGCPRGTRFSEGLGCIEQMVVVVPGLGIAGLRVGESTPQDVLDTYGNDTLINRLDDGKGTVFQINYLYDGDGNLDPERRPNRSRPTRFDFEDGRLTTIVVGSDSKAVRTPGGLNNARSTIEDVFAEFGDRFERRSGHALDIYLYETQGIEVWVHRESKKVNSFRIIPKVQ